MTTAQYLLEEFMESLMQNGRTLENLVECLIQVIGRAAIPEERVAELVGSGAKQVKAFNLCDGRNSQTQIAKQAGLDQGNFSRACARWVEAGVAFWVGEGKEARVLHVYPIRPKSPRGGATRWTRKPKAKGRKRVSKRR